MTVVSRAKAMDDDKRECILKAAVRAFSKMGFRKTSIDEVAAEAGVGKGTIYLAVSSKDELFLSAVEREVKGFLASGRHVLSAFDDAVELLAGLMSAELREVHKRPLVRQLFVGQTLSTVPQSEVEVDRLQGLARGNLSTALERLRDAAVLREDLEPELGARILQDLEIAALVKTERKQDPEEALAAMDWRRSIGILVRGLRRPLTIAPPKNEGRARA